MISRTKAAKELAKETYAGAKAWWNSKSSGGLKDQTATWIAAVGIPAALIGFAVYPRLTLLVCAAAYVWKRIEEKRS